MPLIPEAHSQKAKAADPLADFKTFWAEAKALLPYADKIKLADAKAWHAAALASSKTVGWHLRRLGDAQGALVGGSEIGALVCNHFREPHPFNETPVSLYAKKLMQDKLAENPAMRFGTRFEATCLAALESQRPGWVLDQEAMQAFSNARQGGVFGRDLNGMAYSPDAIYRTPEGRRILVDAKVQLSRHVPNDPPLSYVSQLHQGALVAQGLNVPVDSMMLAYYLVPVRQGETPALVLFDDIALDPVLTDLIPQLVEDFRDHVARGHIPRPLPDEAMSALLQVESQLIDLRAEQYGLEQRAQVLEQLINEKVSSLTSMQISKLGLLEKVRTTYTVDAERTEDLLDAAVMLDVDLQEYTTPAPRPAFDESKVSAALRELGFDQNQIDALRTSKTPDKIDFSRLARENPALVDSGEAFYRQKTSFSIPEDLLIERLKILQQRHSESAGSDLREELPPLGEPPQPGLSPSPI